ncbi:MAG: hypothetical protein EZS28_021904 [Streblomastix strix]|uniref:Ubiquitin-like domain-containing protein n=1 Tax=Streblomastix strix TaxID=222440 RepID=A0A5J4VJL1_9EUKA|nr:MAG: hypothetical protein EZS28_021904 [Streblomastix strix]
MKAKPQKFSWQAQKTNEWEAKTMADFPILIKKINDLVLSVKVNNATTIKTVKEKLHTMEDGLQLDKMLILWRGRELKDTKTIGQAEITENSTVYLLIRRAD